MGILPDGRWRGRLPSGEQLTVSAGDSGHHGLGGKSFECRFRPAAPIAWARDGSESSRRMAAESAAGSSDGTTNPLIPSCTASAFPPTSVATTGRDAAMASTMALEKPSLREGRTKMSAAAGLWASVLSSLADRISNRPHRTKLWLTIIQVITQGRLCNRLWDEEILPSDISLSGARGSPRH
jgi:hypothetical protein